MRSITILLLPVFISLLTAFRFKEGDGIQHYNWSLIKIREGLKWENVDSCRLFIAFTDSLLAMNDGCNWHGGTYSTNGDTLMIKIRVSTEADCRGNEPCYRLRLSEKSRFNVRNDTLEIRQFNSGKLYVFTRGEKWER